MKIVPATIGRACPSPSRVLLSICAKRGRAQTRQTVSERPRGPFCTYRDAPLGIEEKRVHLVDVLNSNLDPAGELGEDGGRGEQLNRVPVNINDGREMKSIVSLTVDRERASSKERTRRTASSSFHPRLRVGRAPLRLQ